MARAHAQGVHGHARPDGAVVHRARPVRDARLAHHRQPRDGDVAGSDVRHHQAGDLRFLEEDIPAFQRQQHRGLLRAPERAHDLPRAARRLHLGAVENVGGEHDNRHPRL